MDALANVMLGDHGFSEAQGLSGRGIEIDDRIGVVQQMSEQFYDYAQASFRNTGAGE